MIETFDMPKTIDELYEQYGMRDYKEVYSNGTQYIPLFRIKQWLEMNGYDKAIEKQTPKKPKYSTVSFPHYIKENDPIEHGYNACPCCDNMVFEPAVYCRNCGQALSWEDEND